MSRLGITWGDLQCGGGEKWMTSVFRLSGWEGLSGTLLVSRLRLHQGFWPQARNLYFPTQQELPLTDAQARNAAFTCTAV